MDDGSQLTPPGSPDSSCEAIDASASSATCYSIDFHHSEGISHGYMVGYQRSGTRIGWRFGWRGTRQTMQTPRFNSNRDKHQGTYKS